ncbi:MAG: hypothetical protein J6Y93_07340 [Treponema sp.]|nr:hypothetical protein [Treponema sp.]
MKKWYGLYAILLIAVVMACDDGVQKSYWENGKLKSELRYIEGKLNGECVWYDSNGQRQTQASYVDDTLEGQYLRWHPNGQLAEERWYKKGVQDSVCLTSVHLFLQQGVLPLRQTEEHICL